MVRRSPPGPRAFLLVATVLLPALLLAAGTGSGQAARGDGPALVTVGPAGNYTTIGAAIAGVAPGTRIVVVNGTYPEHLVIDRSLTLEGKAAAVLDAGGTGTAVRVRALGVTIIGLTILGSGIGGAGIDIEAGGPGTILRDISLEGHPTAGVAVRADGVTLDGLAVRKSGTGVVASHVKDLLLVDLLIPAPASAGISGTGLIDSRIDGAYIPNAGGIGIRLVGSTNITIEDSRIPTPKEEGINSSLTAGPLRLMGNTVQAAGGHGIALEGREPVVDGNTVDGTAGAGIFLANADGARVEGNRISGADMAGILFLDGVEGAAILDNTINGSAGPGIIIGSFVLGGRSAGNTIRNNTLTANGGGIAIIETLAASSGTGPDVIEGNTIEGGFAGISLLAFGYRNLARRISRTRRCVSQFLELEAPVPCSLHSCIEELGLQGLVRVVDLPHPTAFCYGLLRPRICLSSALVMEMSPAQLRAVLLHERHHLLRRHPLKTLLLETLVDAQRFRGTCYRAANWLHVGQTAGRGRMDREHQNHGQAVKDIYVYPLVRDARDRLCGDPTR